MGEVKNPGTKSLSLGARVLDAVSLAGGPTEEADIENIRITRGDSSILLDMEAILTGRDMEQNRQLKTGDVLYVPSTTIKVTLLGEVKQQGLYELKRGVHLSDLIAKAGGLLETADREATYVSGNEQKSIDLNSLMSGNLGSDPVLEDGDRVYVHRTVYQVGIMGVVNRPGSYPWYPEMNLAELLAKAGNIREQGNLENIKIISRDGSIVSVNFKEYLEAGLKEANPDIQAGDIVFVDSIAAMDWETVFFFVRGLNSLKDLLGLQW